mmetsp:Transcript_22750/g.54769  ORF Transcript_22750/g.54769 Transcript_22750/m.54769 type:complete len:103 (-) Transcript_22750:18-326(-)
MPSKRPPVVAQSGLPTHARFMDKKERSQAPARRSETTSRPQCSRVPYQRTTERDERGTMLSFLQLNQIQLPHNHILNSSLCVSSEVVLSHRMKISMSGSNEA